MDPLLGTLAFVVGIAVGSFLNVVILRTRSGHSVVHERSRCPHCQHPLSWWELIPLFSFVVLGGRCHACHKAISWQYPLVEFLTGLAFVASVWIFDLSWLALASGIGLAGLILVGVFDARWGLIPDAFTIVIGLAALIRFVAEPSARPEQLIGLAVGGGFFGLQYALSRGRWIGSGDVLLGLALGAWLGWKSVLLGFGIAYVVGALVAAGLMLLRRLKMKQTMPFGPYLVGAAAVVWFWGPDILEWYLGYVGIH